MITGYRMVDKYLLLTLVFNIFFLYLQQEKKNLKYLKSSYSKEHRYFNCYKQI